MRPFEFWHPRIFETPYYLYLLMLCARQRLPVKFLAKANFALDHGELGLGSKYATQMAFAQDRFLPTSLLDPSNSRVDIEDEVKIFARAHGYPLILKPDIGAVGKGIMKLHDEAETLSAVDVIRSPYIIQAFTPFNCEVGVFFIRQKGLNRITGVNKKHFPTIVGNGHDTIATLAKSHYRFTDNWQIFLKYIDTDRIPDKDESVQLSFIGSHTMGCKFTDDMNLITPDLERSVFTVCDTQPGFNFGRLDLKADSEEALLGGEFVVMEVNGVASLPTHMFDPNNTIWRAYKIFLEHGRALVDIAVEHRDKSMPLKSYSEIWQLAKSNHALLNQLHHSAMKA